jgi:hypothetical protein
LLGEFIRQIVYKRLFIVKNMHHLCIRFWIEVEQ